MRYDAEAALNQNIGYLLELQVRKANVSAERHHKRSQKFFFGMLAAQAAIIVSTFAMAARQRNLLWTLAALRHCRRRFCHLCLPAGLVRHGKRHGCLRGRLPRMMEELTQLDGAGPSAPLPPVTNAPPAEAPKL